MSSVKEDNLTRLLNLKFNEIHTSMKEYAKINNVPIISDEGLAFLETILKIKQPKKILEIGSAIGFSASRMAISTSAEVYTIERNKEMYDCAVEYIEKLNLNSKVFLIFKDALDAFDDVSDNLFDVIFIDAAKAQYTKFFKLYEPLLKEDGIIITDNMMFHDCLYKDGLSRNLRQLMRKLNDYHNFLLENNEYETSIFNIGDGMAVSKKIK